FGDNAMPLPGASTGGASSSIFLNDPKGLFQSRGIRAGDFVRDDTEGIFVRVIEVVSETKLKTEAVGNWSGDAYSFFTPVAGGQKDVIQGGAGDDWIYGQDGNDDLSGGANDDWIFGGTGADVIKGEGGNDHLFGNSDPDQLFGGPGDDYLEGGPGNDTAKGSTGMDTMVGGHGSA